MNQDNVSEFSDISTHGQLFQWASTICCSSTDLLAMSQDNVSELSDISTHGQLFQWVCTLCWSSTDLLDMNQDNVLEFSDISNHRLLFQLASTMCWSSTKTYWLWVRIMCQSSVTFLPTESCFSELPLYVGLVQRIIGYASRKCVRV